MGFRWLRERLGLERRAPAAPREVLVFYALPSDDAPVGPQTPRLALPDLDPEDMVAAFSPDQAPYLSVLDRAQWAEELGVVRARAFRDRGTLPRIARVERWFAAQGLPWIGWQHEVEAGAGEGDAGGG